MDGKTFWQIYDIIDGWYHEQTRHHLEDVGNSKQLVENVEAYLTRVQVELVEEIIGEDENTDRTKDPGYQYYHGRNDLRAEQRKALLAKLTVLGGADEN